MVVLSQAHRMNRFPTSVALVCAWLALGTACQRDTRSPVVVYTAQDQVYAEPLLKAYGVETGSDVRPVFDSEAVKTVGLVNRLIAERGHPQADVFWNNEELRSHQLAAAGVFAPVDGFVRFGHRSRRLVINTNLLSLAQAPRRFSELTNDLWQGKVALAYPLFGTTATHFLALRQRWGREPWLAWCRALASNRPKLLDGNSQVVRMVGRGEAVVGMTDSDDVLAGQRAGLPVIALPLTEESLLIPNTAGVVVGGPHPAAARRLLERLQSAGVLGALIHAGALEGDLGEAGRVETLQPDWPKLLGDLDRATTELKEVFLR
jgi:iron(III) transport system substrate-binding protein